MKRHLFSTVLILLALVMLYGCATTEERAARAAEKAVKVKAALSERNYKISIARMYPMRGGSKTVSYGYTVEVRNDTLISYLPFMGRAYNIPYGGGKGLNFSERIESYLESQKKNGQYQIEIGVTNDEDTYLYIIGVFDNGSSSIEVLSRQRESISYSGEMLFEE